MSVLGSHVSRSDLHRPQHGDRLLPQSFVSWVRTCIHLAGDERDSRPGTSDRFSNPCTGPSWSEVKRPGCPAATSELERASQRSNKTNLKFQRSRRRGADRSSKHHQGGRCNELKTHPSATKSYCGSDDLTNPGHVSRSSPSAITLCDGGNRNHGGVGLDRQPGSSSSNPVRAPTWCDPVRPSREPSVAHEF